MRSGDATIRSRVAPGPLLGVSQPRVVAIEHSRNVTIEVLDQYVNAVGGTLEVNVVRGKIALIGKPSKKAAKPSARAPRSAKSA